MLRVWWRKLFDIPEPKPPCDHKWVEVGKYEIFSQDKYDITGDFKRRVGTSYHRQCSVCKDYRSTSLFV